MDTIREIESAEDPFSHSDPGGDTHGQSCFTRLHWTTGSRTEAVGSCTGHSRAQYSCMYEPCAGKFAHWMKRETCAGHPKQKLSSKQIILAIPKTQTPDSLNQNKPEPQRP